MRERRTLQGAEVRAGSDGKTIRGYAAVFGAWSEDLGGFREQIKPGAFKRAIALSQDVRCLFNHDQNRILGRTRSGTLEISEDSTGLSFVCGVPDSPTGRDVYTAVARGDVTGCSFSFAARKEDWASRGTRRTLLDVDLFDVGPVVNPAYPQTSIAARSAATSEPERRGNYILSRSQGLYLPEPELDPWLETDRRRLLSRLLEMQS